MSSGSYVVKTDGLPHIPKDPDAHLIYTWDWTEWMTLAGATSISSATLSPDLGLVVDGAMGILSGRVAQQFSGGLPGHSYQVTCHAVFNNGEEDERTIVIDVLER